MWVTKNNIYTLFFLSITLSTNSFSEGFRDLDQKLILDKNRGIDVLNFYQEVEEQNKIRHYVRYEYNDDFTLIEWNLAEGYLLLNEKWDFEFDVEREFFLDQDFGTESRSLNGWDSLVGFVKDTGTRNAFGKEWTTDLGFMWEYDRLTIPSTFGGNFDKSELAIRYRIRTDADIGMGGTFWGFDFWAAKVFVTGDDGYSLEANLLAATNWGYGFQTFSTLHNEYYDWGGFDGTHRLGLESFTRWTHELSEHWAFSIEMGLEGDKFSGGSPPSDSDIQVTIAPYLLYNREVYEDFRVFAEIGLPGYRYRRTESEFGTTSGSGLSYIALIGIEYIW